MHFVVPEDTEVAHFVFQSTTLSTDNSIAVEECPKRDISVFLKRHSLPVVNLDASAYPTGSKLGDRVPIFTVKLNSDSDIKIIEIILPVPGDWFAVAFLPIKENDISLKYKFIEECSTLIRGSLLLTRIFGVPILPIDSPVVVSLHRHENSIRIFKFMLPENVWSSRLLITITSGKKIFDNLILVNIRAKNIPMLNSSDTITTLCQTPNCTIDFIPIPQSWYYLSIKKLSNGPLNLTMRVFMFVYRNSDSYRNEIIRVSDSLIEMSSQKRTSLRKFEENWRVIPVSRIKYSSFFKTQYLESTKNEEEVSRLTLLIGEIVLLKFHLYGLLDTGGSLTLEIILDKITQSSDFVIIMCCLTYEVRTLPIFPKDCIDSNEQVKDSFLSVNTSMEENHRAFIHMLFPESGTWYVTLKAICFDNRSLEECKCENVKTVAFNYFLGTDSCIRGKCGEYGTCYRYVGGSIVYSACLCYYGFKGWDCTDDSDRFSFADMLLSILLLTASNLSFFVTVYVAARRKYYAEALVYAASMIASIFYHACDGREVNILTYCITKHSTLQYSDFYLAIVSVWVTFVAISGLDNTCKYAVLVVGTIGVAIGTEADRMSIWVLLVPSIVGIVMMVGALLLQYKANHKVYPSITYWKIFFPIGLIIAGIGMLLFGYVQTESNYKYVHSAWHTLMAICIIFLLPRRCDVQQQTGVTNSVLI